MTFTQDEENILKLIIQEMKVKRKYANERKSMNERIRTETTALSQQIQDEYTLQFAPFISEINVIEAALKEKCE